MLTEKQAFLAMYNFIEEYFVSKPEHLEVGILLGSLILEPNGDCLNEELDLFWKRSLERAKTENRCLEISTDICG
jgi:hypothetical protein